MRTNIDSGIVQHDLPHKGGAVWAVSIEAEDDLQWWDDYFYKRPNATALKHLAKARIMGKQVYIFFWTGKVWTDFDTSKFIEECKNAKR